MWTEKERKKEGAGGGGSGERRRGDGEEMGEGGGRPLREVRQNWRCHSLHALLMRTRMLTPGKRGVCVCEREKLHGFYVCVQYLRILCNDACIAIVSNPVYSFTH